MDEKTSRRIWDRGKVYKDGERIAEVVYALQIVQEIVGGIAQEDISGQVRVVEGKRNLADEGNLILWLSGGRKWEFFASLARGLGVYDVKGTSPAGPASN